MKCFTITHCKYGSEAIRLDLGGCLSKGIIYLIILISLLEVVCTMQKSKFLNEIRLLIPVSGTIP